jgi:hypothetical protein
MALNSIRTLACAVLVACGLGAADARATSTAAHTDANAIYDEAAAAARAGDADSAFARLDAALAAGFSDGATIEYDEDLAKLRTDPRWADFHARFDRANPAAKYLLLLRNQKLSAAERYFPVSQALSAGLQPPPRMAGEFLQTFATQATFLGRYEEAARVYDTRPSRFDPIAQGFREARSANEWILAQAADRQALFLNESHGEVQTRAANLALLASLRRLGFRYLALEGLTAVAPGPGSTQPVCQRATLFDADLQKRGYPTAKSGYYLDEPVFGEVVREAVRLGFELVAYDPYVAEDSDADREQAQAANLSCLFRQDPRARLVLVAGFSHIAEQEGPGLPPGGAMALRFKALSGIDPLTIDRTSLMRLPADATPAVAPTQTNAAGAFVLTNSSAVAFGSPKYDASLWSPPLGDNREGPGPSWLELGGLRHRVRVHADVCAGKNPCLLEARAQSESDQATPADRCAIGPAQDHCSLFLAPGRYRLSAWDASMLPLGHEEVTSP